MHRTVSVDRARARVYEHGWQSWSPTAAYRLDERPFRPVSERGGSATTGPTATAPADAFWGEGLLAVDPGTGEGVHVFGGAVRRPARSPRCGPRSTATGGRAPAAPRASSSTVADGGRRPRRRAGPVGRRFAARPASARCARRPRPGAPGTTTSSGSPRTTSRRTCAPSSELDLAVDVVQIDDGYQAEIGDWLRLSDRFASLGDIVGRIRGAGRRAGIWVAPFLVGERSRLAREHPEWLVGGRRAPAPAGADQQLAALDVTHPGRRGLPARGVRHAPRRSGIDYFKIDFIYAGAMEGRAGRPGVAGVDAYRHGLRIIREAIGREAYLLGCGAPILPSVGLVDAMRVGPDIAHHYEPRGRRPVPALPAGGRAEQPVAGLAARPVLGQRRRLPGRRPARGAAGGVGATVVERYSGLRGQQRPAPRPRRVGPGDHPPAAPAGAGRPVRALTAAAPAGTAVHFVFSPPAEAAAGLLNLPWDQPLEEWADDRLTEIPQRGISRHVVRFVAEERRGVRAQGDPRAAGPPRVHAAAPAQGAGHPRGRGARRRGGARPTTSTPMLVTRFLDYSSSFRALFANPRGAHMTDRLMDAQVELLARLHLAGVIWGDCSLSNTLFRFDAGALAAYLVDAETAEMHAQLSAASASTTWTSPTSRSPAS